MKNVSQKVIDDSPAWIKQAYIASIRGVRAILQTTGGLAWLDRKARESREFHFWRSLLAIHDISDLFHLDVPWWTYSAIDALLSRWEHWGRPIQVFEWGSGASTVWLAKRADRVISVEHDPTWYKILQPALQAYPSVTCLLREPERLLVDQAYASRKMPGVNFKSYVTAIQEQAGHYDLIVIDGRARAACLAASIPYLKASGMILLDNSDRAEYQNAISHSGLTIERFKGRVPCSPLPGETAFLYKV